MSRPLDPIAAQLRAERTRLGLSLTQAAPKVGLEAVVIGSYERGDRIPPLDRLRTWSEGMGHRLIAVPTDVAADTPGGHMRFDYAVTYGSRLLPCDSAEQAVELAGLIADAMVVSRAVRMTGWEPQR